ncbi:putative lipotransmembrane domain protein [Burkholderia mallei]|nr:putative lipotransmembrane domain protein [Burkholderia mallei]
MTPCLTDSDRFPPRPPLRWRPCCPPVRRRPSLFISRNSSTRPRAPTRARSTKNRPRRAKPRAARC